MPRKRKEQPSGFNGAFPVSLRKLMQQKGTTQSELAAYLHKTRQAVSYYCDGSSSPDWETLVKIADFYNVPADYLLGRTCDPNPKPAAVDDLGISPEAVAWLHSIKGLSEPNKYGYVAQPGFNARVNTILENREFHSFVESLCNLIDAMEAERLFYSLPAGKDTAANIQKLIETKRLSPAVSEYMKAQAVVGGCDVPEAIRDVFPFGFNVSDVMSNKVNQQLTRLIDDLRKRSATVTGDF